MASHESVVQASATCSAACRTSERACVPHIRPTAIASAPFVTCVVRTQVSQLEAYSAAERRLWGGCGCCVARGRTSCSTCSTLSSGSEKDALLIRRFTKNAFPK